MTEVLLWMSTLTTTVQEEVVGRILALCELAASGELHLGEDLQPIHRDPELYELRWNFGETLVRQYHAEPARLPQVLVKLHLHLKHLATESESLTTELQNQQIGYALLRYRAGERTDWAL
ncbi:hypothetical protein [Microbacterium sp. SS28]|uniref:hypothetical protein n=1 Tax=Microbacterium sp. SS28 TaxID=2919948 RepID=UPI001FAAFCB2|nr:hypothetical protein [Microbacterium sp. SS28]